MRVVVDVLFLDHHWIESFTEIPDDTTNDKANEAALLQCLDDFSLQPEVATEIDTVYVRRHANGRLLVVDNNDRVMENK
ncbi:hypothetical protein [Acinetobacter sp.]|uniref:hypothetical protein n=1 Tax=Acinetobacter sp. TaxID=472 RepID=UPI003D035691